MQQPGGDRFAEKLFTPVRFGILLALLIFAAFPQVLLGLQTFVIRDFGFFRSSCARACDITLRTSRSMASRSRTTS